MWVGRSHNAKSESLGCATVSSLSGWKREALDKAFLPAWGFPNPSPRISWFVVQVWSQGLGGTKFKNIQIWRLPCNRIGSLRRRKESLQPP